MINSLSLLLVTGVECPGWICCSCTFSWVVSSQQLSASEIFLFCSMCCGSSIVWWLGKQEFRDSLPLRSVTSKFRLKEHQLVTQFVSHFQSSWWCWHEGCLERVTVVQTKAKKWICSSGCSWSMDLNAKTGVSRGGAVDLVLLWSLKQ